MRFMQIESVLQTENRSEPAKNRFSVALVESLHGIEYFCISKDVLIQHILSTQVSDTGPIVLWFFYAVVR